MSCSHQICVGGIFQVRRLNCVAIFSSEGTFLTVIQPASPAAPALAGLLLLPLRAIHKALPKVRNQQK